MSHRRTICRTARIAMLSLVAYIAGASGAMAAGHHHGGLDMGGLDDSFDSRTKVLDGELSKQRGGTININGTNITLTISQNVTTYNPVTNLTTTQQFFFSSANIQPTNISQIASVANAPMIVQQSLSGGTVNAVRAINLVIQSSLSSATLSRISSQALFTNVLAAHH